MAARIATTHGTYTGKTVESVVRREYGRKAEVRYSQDPNSAHAGYIVGQPAERHGAVPILATLKRYEGDANTETAFKPREGS